MTWPRWLNWGMMMNKIRKPKQSKQSKQPKLEHPPKPVKPPHPEHPPHPEPPGHVPPPGPPMHGCRCLFLLKRRQDYHGEMENCSYQQVATGMFNSATFVSDMLTQFVHCASKVVMVVDNNCIDREVTKFKATHVFIEGFWMVPAKLDILKVLHPTVKWVVRCHSELPFLSQEGIAVDWTFGYWQRGIAVSGNSPRVNHELKVMAKEKFGWDNAMLNERVPLLTNYYPTQEFQPYRPRPEEAYFDIGCFGAVRPMKNHLMQAIAAIEWCTQHGKLLRFHINRGRVELYGANALKNLEALFEDLPQHVLVHHAWTSHQQFKAILKRMDLCMQVSMTETFNITTADAVVMGVPVVVSSEIGWVYPPYADPHSTVDIVCKMEAVWTQPVFYTQENLKRLRVYGAQSILLWSAFVHP